MSSEATEESSLGYILVLVAGITYSFTAILSTLLTKMGVPSIEQGFFRISVTALLFGLVLLLKSPLRKIRRGDVKFFVINGLFGVSLSIIAYLSSIALGTPVAVAVTLSYLQPMFSVIFARLFLREGITFVKVIAVGTSILGASIVSGLWQVFGTVTSIPVLGALLAAMNGFFYSVYVIVGRLSGSNKSYSFATTMFYSFFFATLWSIPLWLLMSAFINDQAVTGLVLNFPVDALVLVLALIFVSTVTPYALLAMGLRRVKASRAGVILLVEPVSVMIMGVFILNQPLTSWDLAGAILILSATVLVSIEDRIRRHLSKKPRSTKQKSRPA
ncbi:MAG: DMT family transporter [Promethearchaeati archaeon SRVP18_Atabeyarchaeia-1]